MVVQDPSKSLAEAEHFVWTEQGSVALKAAEEAVEGFKGKNDGKGVAEAMYQVAMAHLLMAQTREANKKVEEQLEAFRKADNKYGEAKMLLAQAMVLGKSHDAWKWTQIAQDIFRDLDDKKNEALALVIDVRVLLQKRQTDPEAVEETCSAALAKANGALLLYRGFGDRLGEAHALQWYATAQIYNGLLDEATNTSEKASEAYHDLGLQLMEASCLLNPAKWEIQFRGLLNDEKKALKMAEKSLEIVQNVKSEDPKREMATLGIIIRAYLVRDQVKEAIDVAKQALDRFKEQKNQKAEAEILLMLMQCNLSKELEGTDAAVKQAEQALSHFNQLMDDANSAKVRGLLALLHFKREDNLKAEGMAKRCLEFEGKMAFADKAAAMQVLVGVYLSDKKYPEALKNARKVQELCEAEGQTLREGITLMTICNVYYQMEDYQNALKAAKDAEELFFDVEDRKWQAEAHQCQSEVYQARQEHYAAVVAAERAYSFWRAMGDAQGMAYVLVLAVQNQALLLAKKEKPDDADGPNSYPAEVKVMTRKAMKMAEEAQELSRRLDNKSGLASALAAGAQIHIFNEKFREGLAEIDEASSIYKDLKEPRLLANTLVLSARARLASGRYAEVAQNAVDAAELFKQCGDPKGEQLAMSILEKYQDQADELQGNVMRGTAAFDFGARDGPAAGGGAIEPAAGASQAVAKPSAPTMDADMVAGKLNEVTSNMIGGKEPDWASPLMEAGITSMNAVIYRQKLMEEFDGIRLPVTLVFDYPTVEAIADLILEEGKKLGGGAF